jgi:hypothetical protein
VPPSREELRDQLVTLVGTRLLDPLEILLNGDESVAGIHTIVRNRAHGWANLMLDGADASAVGMVARIVAALYPGDRPFEPPVDWWRTPMGQLVAWRVGHPTAERVSYPVAGAMLGISRQGVHDLVTRGKLTRHPDGGVTPGSVRDRLRQGENPA